MINEFDFVHYLLFLYILLKNHVHQMLMYNCSENDRLDKELFVVLTIEEFYEDKHEFVELLKKDTYCITYSLLSLRIRIC